VAEAADGPLQRAWQLSYLDPGASLALARGLCEEAGEHRAEAQLLVALGEARLAPPARAQLTLDAARSLFAVPADTADSAAAAEAERSLRLCDELQAVLLRRQGDAEASARLQALLDARHGTPRNAMHRFIAHNARAITSKLLGKVDASLRHLHAAFDAAQQTGWPGPYVTACTNLGGRHHDLYNLEDARTYSLQALAAATEVGAKTAQLVSACNLIVIHHASGDLAEASALGATLERLLPGESHEVIEDMTPPLALACMASGEIERAEGLLNGVRAALAHDPAGEWSLAWGWQMARCRLARDDAQGAYTAALAVLQASLAAGGARPGYDLMALQRALADAAEHTGQATQALHHLREAHALYEQLVGRSARARYVALDITHQLEQARHERDVAVDGRRSVEDDRSRLIELNAALQAQMAETERLHEQLREQALHDPLTGLHNRRYLFEVAPGLLERARRQGTPLCVVLLDLDHFKLLNDTCGHAAGDLVLQRFGQLLTETLRKSDVVCRHGGEEFVAVMPDLQADEAQVAITRLLDSFTSLQLALGRRRLPRGSFSAGIALFPNHGATLEQLLSRADRALYAAKNQGRARIEQAPRTGFATLE
jgi:diguanylate cyclase (GGDEF)-like protein